MEKNMTERVVLVNSQNRKVGVMEKMEAHQKGRLHRAFSVFIFNSRGELLLQRRAMEKYHCGGLWANTVCSHPRPGEPYARAARRRLMEEMGFDCKLTKRFCFVYKAAFKNGLTEHEYDCVFTGVFDGEITPDPREVMEYRWVTLKKLKRDIAREPLLYAEWLKIALERVGKLRD